MRTAALVTLLACDAFLPSVVSAAPLGDDFSTGLGQWSVEQMPGGRVYTQDDALVIEDAGGCTVWFRPMLQTPVEISYEAEVVDRGGPFDRVSDLNCFWLASDPKSPAGLFASRPPRTGKFSDYDGLLTYYVGYGGNENTTTRFRRYDGTGVRPLLPANDLRATKFLLQPNHRYRIRIVANGSTTEFWRDGERIFAFDDPHPLQSGYFGFRTVKSHLVIRHFKVVPVTKP